jgi:LmbE family N-acetylglucosaminyl deacetylase
MTDEFQAPKKALTILVVEAHPDDAAFFAGGTLAKLANEGHTLIYLVATYGDKGTLDPKMTRTRVVKIRKDETQRAAQILGVKEVVYLGMADGELEAGLGLRRKFTEVLRRVRPDLVFSFDPNCPYEPHPDHVATARTIYEACFTSHFHLYYPEQRAKGLQPHYVAKLYGWASPNPNTYVDIGATLETKIRALEQYESQMHMLLEENLHRLKLAGMEVPLLSQLDWREVVRLWVTLTAQTAGKQSNHEYAEAFNAIPFGMVGVIADLLKVHP